MKRANKKATAIVSDIASIQAGRNRAEDLVQLSHGALLSYTQAYEKMSLRDLIRKALELASGGSEMIQAIISIKVDFFSAGFGVQIQPKRDGNLEAMRERVANLIRTHQLESVAEELISDLSACDNCILHWKMDGSDLEYVTTLPPCDVEFDNSTGRNILKLYLSEATRTTIKESLRTAKKSSIWPQKYVDAVMQGKPVELKNEDGEYWVVKTHSRRFTGLAKPSMCAIFPDLELRKLFISGDFSVAYFIKHLIQQIKAGEAITSGPKAGQQDNYTSSDELTVLQGHLEKVQQALRLYTNHTVSIETHIPDPKIFTVDKYRAVHSRIVRWARIPDVMMTGEGDGFSQGFLGKNGFEAQGQRIRNHVGWVFSEFFLHPEIMSLLKAPAGSTVQINWDRMNLKEWKEVLDELAWQWENGIMDIQSAHERLGERHDLIAARKEVDQKEKNKWKPTYEPSQGLLNPKPVTKVAKPAPDGEGGRPRTKPSSQREPEPPRPSRGK